ncbi:MAG: gliding motility-associated C-terminal domain-containing protein [Paludibacteraceae bacterium]|nr:gliding motility-associated C-terminal domain-containing protein [Paludibacteraceae bacterium]
MKRNYTILLLFLLLCNIYSFSQKQPSFRGANLTISSLQKSYCSTETNVDIVPDTWDPKTTVITWAVTYDNYSNPNQTSWYSITGTGKSTVLHFNPSAVPATYHNIPIVFTYTQSDGIGPLQTTYDYTRVYKTPSIFTFGKDTTVCPGQTVNLKLSGSEDSINYILYKDGSKTGTKIAGNGLSLTFTVSAAGTYTVKAQNKSDSLCTEDMTGSATISLYSINTPTITGSSDVCIGSSNVIYSTESGQSNYSWSISSGGIITSSTTSDKIAVTWFTLGSQNITVNYSNSNGCSASTPTTYNVNVHALPVPTITGATSTCKGTTVTYRTEPGMSNYTWTVDGKIISGATDSLAVQWNTIGNKSISVTYTDTYGCTPSTPTSESITVNDIPTPTISGTAELCQGTSGVIYSTESGQSDYTWTIIGGTITSGATTNQAVVTWTTEGAQTISVNYANAAGCRAITPTVYNVTVRPLPTPTVSGKDSVCLGEINTVYTTEPGQTDYSWTITSGGSIISGGNTNAITVDWSTAGVQTLTVTYKNNYGCVPASATNYNVIVSAKPTPTITGLDSICNGSTNVTYTTETGQKNYGWNISSGGSITSGQGTYQINVTWNTAGNQTVSVNYTNASGCTATVATTKNIYVKTLPIPTISGPKSFCIDTTDIKTYTTESGQFNYTWTVSSSGTILSGASTNSITVKWAATGAQTVSVNYTDPKGCTAATPTVYNIAVNPVPTPTISGMKSICQGTKGVTYTTEPGQSNYSWNITGGTITNGANTNVAIVTWDIAGLQTISVNYSNDSGCYAPKVTVDTINVISAATPAITGTSKVCVGTSGVTYTTETGMNNYTWTISSGGTITNGATTNEITVTWNAAGTQTISVDYQNSLGCAAVTPATETVTVYSIPVPAISGSTSVCKNATSVYTTDSGMISYTWTVVGGTIISGANTDTITVKWNSLGKQVLTLNYVNQGNCTAATPASDTIMVNDLPTPTISGNDTVCANGGSVMFTTEKNQFNYVWSITGGGVINSGQGTDTVKISWNTAGNKIVSVNYQNSAGCSAASATTHNVYAKASPTPTINGTQHVCVGTTGIAYKTEAGFNNYQWTVTGGTITSGLGTDSVNVTWTIAGNQSISVNYTNSNLCSASSPTVHNVVVDSLPVPTITASNGGCNATTTTYTTDAGMLNYVWTVSGGYSAISGNGTNTLLVTWNTTGVQTVRVTYQTTIGCTPATPTIKTVTVINNPTVSLSANDTSICKGEVVTFNATSGLANYDFYINGSAINTSATPSYSTASLNNSDKIYVIGTNSNGCIGTSSTITMNVFDYPVATLKASPDTIIVVGTNVTFTASGTGNYQFYLNGSIVQSYSSNNKFSSSTLNNGNIISVKVKNSNGCTDSAKVRMTVLDSITRRTIQDSSIIYCTGTYPNGITVFMSNPQSGVSYELIRVSDSYSYGIGTVSGSSVAWNNVNNTFNGTQKYKVIGYYSILQTYIVEMTNRINITKVAMPNAYNILPTDTVKMCSGGNSGAEVKLSGSSVGVSYYLYKNGTYTGTVVSGTGSAISFGNINDAGNYTIRAKSDVGGCETLMSGSSIFVFDMNSPTCYPFEAVPDELYLSADASSGSIHVSNNTLGGNDILNASIDKNLQYTLITSWTDLKGKHAETNGTVSFSDKDYFTYTKQDNYYGKDSVIYQITNLNYPTRTDTAIIHIFIGNKTIDDGITILIPNAFSPNGDGKNDRFVIEGIENQLSSILKVFNRWGSQVYQSGGTSYQNDWDGNSNKGGVTIGKELPVGTYFYVFTISFDKDGNTINKKYSGYIELRR